MHMYFFGKSYRIHKLMIHVGLCLLKHMLLLIPELGFIGNIVKCVFWNGINIYSYNIQSADSQDKKVHFPKCVFWDGIFTVFSQIYSLDLYGHVLNFDIAARALEHPYTVLHTKKSEFLNYCC